MTKIYLDVCCLNRPFDDQTQDRVRLESESIVLILAHCEARDWTWVSSTVVDYEIDQTPDVERSQRVKLIGRFAHEKITPGKPERERAQELELLGFQSFDALHLACAESGTAEVFLTTDDRLLRLAARYTAQLRVHLANPLMWLSERSEI
jgi:hypothetical protein